MSEQSRAERIRARHGPPASWLLPWSHEQHFDFLLADMVQFSEEGDAIARKRLHELLAQALREGNLTEAGAELLAEMHEAIARGERADAATLTQKLPHRAGNRLRDWMIAHAVQWRIGRHEYWMENRHRWPSRFPRLDAKWSTLKLTGKNGLYAQIGAEHGLSPKTVENIHQAWVRAALEEVP